MIGSLVCRIKDLRFGSRTFGGWYAPPRGYSLGTVLVNVPFVVLPVRLLSAIDTIEPPFGNSPVTFWVIVLFGDADGGARAALHAGGRERHLHVVDVDDVVGVRCTQADRVVGEHHVAQIGASEARGGNAERRAVDADIVERSDHLAGCVASVTPDRLLLRIRTLSSVRLTLSLAATSTPCWVNSLITMSSTKTEDAWTTRMPSIPVRVPAVPTDPGPLMLSPRSAPSGADRPRSTRC